MFEPKPEEIINIEGKEGRTIFRRLITWCLPENASEVFQNKLDEELFEPIQDIKNDRLLILIGSLVVENTLDGLLTEIMPGYQNLRNNRDFSFSMRTEIAKALNIIPNWILNNIDFIRGLRNDFVHDLSLEKLDQLDKSEIQSMDDRLSKYTSKKYDTYTDRFRMLVVFTAVALYSYKFNVAKLNDFIRHESFGEYLRQFVESEN